MNKISESHIQDIKNRLDIVDVIASRIDLRRKGSGYFARCPFHDEKTESFSVKQKDQFYKCFGCGVGGDHIKFIQEYDGLSFREAVKTLSKMAGIEVQEDQEQSIIIPRADRLKFEEELYFLRFYSMSVIHGVKETWEDKKRYKIAISRINALKKKYESLHPLEPLAVNHE